MYGEVFLADSHPTFRSDSALPYVSFGDAESSCNLALIGDVFFFNRGWLRDQFRPHPDGAGVSCDRALALAAYAKWGEQCVDYFEGEFSFAVWDQTRRTLFGCRDHMGGHPFFYFHDSARFVFADDPRPILAHPDVPRKLNFRKLAAAAVREGLRSTADETFHAGVSVLAPDTWMKLDHRGFRRQLYWTPEIRENLVPRSEDDIYGAVRESLQHAVERRLARYSKPFALLSGGLDSSAVVSLAARYFAQGGKSLTAVAGVLTEDARAHLADEREYIDEFRSVPGVTVEHVFAGAGGPFDRIDDPKYFECGFLRNSRVYLYEALESAAVGLGADVLLDGVGGEFGPTTWGTPYYAELAVTGRWLTLCRELRARGPRDSISPIRILAAQLRDLARPQSRFSPAVLFRRDFIQSTGLRTTTFSRPARWPNQRKQQKKEIQGWLARDAVRIPISWPAPIRHSSPLMDRNVLELCLSIPPKYKVRNGYHRYLVRRGLDGILPPKIQWRMSKAPFSPDYYIRYNRQIAKARDFVASMGANHPIGGVVDLNELNVLLSRPPVSYGDAPALGTIPYTIYLISFLRQFSEFRA